VINKKCFFGQIIHVDVHLVDLAPMWISISIFLLIMSLVSLITLTLVIFLLSKFIKLILNVNCKKRKKIDF